SEGRGFESHHAPVKFQTSLYVGFLIFIILELIAGHRNPLRSAIISQKNKMESSGKSENNNWSYGKWFTENTGSWFDLYNKQMKDMISFYNNFYKLYEDPKSSDKYENPYSWFNWNLKNWNNMMSPINAMYKNGAIWNEFNTGYGKMMDKISDWNKEFFGSVYKQLENDESDMENIRLSWAKFIESQMEQSQKLMNVLNEAFQKRMEFNSQIFKTMIRSMNQQSHVVNDQSAKILDEISKMLKTENLPIKSKETVPEKKVPVY
ncbi:MAG: hypothetical protein ACK452_14640, partial [Bacteroidota bacterium]